MFKRYRIRLISAWRCLWKPHYILITWTRCKDGGPDFRISRVELPEAIHRLKVDAVEILQAEYGKSTRF